MLTYLPPDQRPPAPTYEKPWLLLLLVFAWLWPGVFSHDLWNPAEPTVNASINEILAGGRAWLPTVLGEPLYKVSPVYIWLAAACRQLFSPWLADAYSASRFASVIFTVIGLTASGMAGFHLLDRHQGRSVVLIMVGSAGLIGAAHMLGGMSVQFAALGLILYGFALARTRVIMASLLLGIGLALLSLSAGYLVPLAVVLTAVSLLSSTHWQHKRYYISLFGALAVGLPLMAVYPSALFKTDPVAFETWRLYHAFGSFGGFENFRVAFSAGYYLKNLLWFAFPAWPLAIWTLLRGDLAKEPWMALSLAWLAEMGLLLAADPSSHQDNLLWILPPLALLGAARLDSLRRGPAAFLNWFGIMTFGLAAVFLWMGFFAMNYGWPAKLAERAAYFSPFYTPHIALIPMLVAILFSPIWLWAITRKNIRGRQAVTNWAAGMTLVWALLMTLFLHWLDRAKSYRPVVEQMEAAAPADLQTGTACINIPKNEHTARLAWGEYSRLPLRIQDESCTYRLVRTRTDDTPPSGWQKVWQGNRPRSKEMVFVLTKKSNHTEH
ncbi:ArnT family glycosyltransferase [Neisseria wadsworthii]|uniref:Inner membrane protein n=1 Tax=Neisseria wadsworthii 9715 TaxID=1030841 RepID=G4CML8_9NEIS|nr:membrane protein [Neisseria wadsworthii]EGZ51068.1 inner membrane protein [Neisseria wadsworthii 9715]QMT36347.1 glycosyltransferase family 39 protein [Neisseria wadsworthii]